MDERTERVNHGHVYPRPDGMKARCGGPMWCTQCRREATGTEVPPVDQILLSGPPEAPAWLALLRDEPVMSYADLRDAEAVERADLKGPKR